MKKIFTTLLSSFIILTGVYAQKIAPFHAGDRVAFVGNSITDGGHYHSYIWLYYMTHFPNMRITCFNAGIGGDAIDQIYNRFDDDVFGKNPTVLTLTWGMNDSGYFEWYRADGQAFMDKRIEGSYKYYGMLEDKLKSRPDKKRSLSLVRLTTKQRKATLKIFTLKKVSLSKRSLISRLRRPKKMTGVW